MLFQPLNKQSTKINLHYYDVAIGFVTGNFILALRLIKYKLVLSHILVEVID